MNQKEKKLLQFSDYETGEPVLVDPFCVISMMPHRTLDLGSYAAVNTGCTTVVLATGRDGSLNLVVKEPPAEVSCSIMSAVNEAVSLTVEEYPKP